VSQGVVESLEASRRLWKLRHPLCSEIKIGSIQPPGVHPTGSDSFGVVLEMSVAVGGTVWVVHEGCLRAFSSVLMHAEAFRMR